MLAWGHRLRVAIGERAGSGLELSSELGAVSLRVAFEIKRDASEEPNAGKVQIWNLSTDTRSEIAERGSVCVIEAGIGELGTIGTFQANEIQTARDRVDLVTTLSGGDGALEYGNAQVNKSLNSGSTHAEALSELARTIGLSVGYMPPVTRKVLPRGITLYGNTRDILSDLCESLRVEWSIQDGELVIVEIGKSPSVDVAVVTPQTGLIGEASEITDDDYGPGVEFSALINARIQPNKLVQVNGALYRVFSVTHTGDTHGSEPFKSIVRAFEVTE